MMSLSVILLALTTRKSTPGGRGARAVLRIYGRVGRLLTRLTGICWRALSAYTYRVETADLTGAAGIGAQPPSPSAAFTAFRPSGMETVFGRSTERSRPHRRGPRRRASKPLSRPCRDAYGRPSMVRDFSRPADRCVHREIYAGSTRPDTRVSWLLSRVWAIIHINQCLWQHVVERTRATAAKKGIPDDGRTAVRSMSPWQICLSPANQHSGIPLPLAGTGVLSCRCI